MSCIGLPSVSHTDSGIRDRPLSNTLLAGGSRLVLVGIVGLFVAASLFAHPIADDLDFASGAREAGIATAWRQQYLTWNGRYASDLLAFAIPLSPDSLTGYRAAIAAMPAAIVTAVYVLLRALAPILFTRAEAATGALALSALYLGQMPSLGEGIYWYTSAVTYHAALVLAALHLACVAHAWRRKTWPALIAAIVLLVAVAGCNEVVVGFMLVLHGALLLAARDRGGKIVFATLLAVTIAGAAVVVGSPGNAAREVAYPLRHQLGRSLLMTALQTARFLGAWVASGPLLLASLVWLSQSDRLAPVLARTRRLHLVGCAVGLVLVVPLATFPAYWTTGILGQHRTINMAYFVFLLLWFAALGLWSWTDGTRAAAVRTVAVRLRLPAALALLAALAVTGNAYAIEADWISGRFIRFDREMAERDRTLHGCHDAARAVCEIDPIETVPTSFFVLDASGDARDWVNVAYARHYGLAQVRLTRSPLSNHVRH